MCDHRRGEGEVVAFMIGLISGAFGLMAGATLWGVALVSGFPVGPQILFLVGFVILVSTLVGTIAVALYRLWIRRKRKALEGANRD